MVMPDGAVVEKATVFELLLKMVLVLFKIVLRLVLLRIVNRSLLPVVFSVFLRKVFIFIKLVITDGAPEPAPSS